MRASSLPAVFLLVAALTLALACGDGGGGDEIQEVTTSLPDAESQEGDEERVIAEVSDAYKYLSDGNYEALWSTYTSAFQDRCSYDDMVVVLNEIKQSEGWDELVPTEIQVNVLDGKAVAAYVLEAMAGGDIIDKYDYRVTYFQEDGEWRAQETCY